MPRVILFNKPYGVICQFSPSGGKQALKDFVPVTGVYPAGRLDTDSEGLLVLTDDGTLQHTISHPAKKWLKSYWVQVENCPGEAALDQIRGGVDLGNFVSAPARVRPSPNHAAYGRALRRSVRARVFPPVGSTSKSAKARTARSGA